MPKPKTKRASDIFEPVQSLESAIEVLAGAPNLTDFKDSVPPNYRQDFLDRFERTLPTLQGLHMQLEPGQDLSTLNPGYDQRAIEKIHKNQMEFIATSQYSTVEEGERFFQVRLTLDSMYNFYVAIRYLDEHLAANWLNLLQLPPTEQARLNGYLGFALEQIKEITAAIHEQQLLEPATV